MSQKTLQFKQANQLELYFPKPWHYCHPEIRAELVTGMTRQPDLRLVDQIQPIPQQPADLKSYALHIMKEFSIIQ